MGELVRMSLALALGVAVGVFLTEKPLRTAVAVRRTIRRITPPPHRPHRHAYNSAQLVSRN